MQPRRERDRLRVIARGERDDAGAALRGIEPRQRVVGAAELEGAHALQVLALEEKRGGELRVGGAGGKDRGAVGVPGDAPRRQPRRRRRSEARDSS